MARQLTYRVLALAAMSWLLLAPPSFAQDTSWTQAMGGWLDGVYYPNFFLGGNYYTRIALADIDADGDLDMFYGGGSTGSLVYFENIGSPSGPEFVLGLEELPGLTTGPYTTRIVDADFADIDSDGDLDAAFSMDRDRGGALGWNDGTPSQPNFVIRLPAGPSQGQGNVTLADIDNDGDYDYFSGAGYRNQQLIFAENIGNRTQPQYAVRSYNYQNLYFDIPFNFDMGDLDGDGDFDIIFCKEGGAVGLYTNIGTADSAHFALADSNYLPFRDTTDWMEVPELADIDADGDLDLFLAGAYAHLYFFENIGTIFLPQFVQRSDTSYFYNFMGFIGSRQCGAADFDGDGNQDINAGGTVLLNQSRAGQVRFERHDNILPPYLGKLCDLDADGDHDFVCVGAANTPGYFENTGGTSWPPQWAAGRDLFPEDGHLTNPFDVALADLDADGDLDMYITHAVANYLVYYRNDGTPQAYNFAYQGNISLPNMTYQTYTGVYLTDMDLDGDCDLLLADMSGNTSYPVEVRFFHFRNDGTPQAPRWTYVTNDFQNILRDHRQGGITLNPVDIDGDGDRDLLISTSLGLQLYLNPMREVAIDEGETRPSEAGISLRCYPNPFNSATVISISGVRGAEIGIYDITGRLITKLQAEGGRAVWEASAFSSGVYFARVMGERSGNVLRLVVVR